MFHSRVLVGSLVLGVLGGLVGCTAGPSPTVRHAKPSGRGGTSVETVTFTGTDTRPDTTDTTDTTDTDPGTTDTTDTTDPGTTDTTDVPDIAGPLYGIDVSHWQGDIDWDAVYADGMYFAIMKATEGTYYTDDQFSRNYNGSYNAGLIRGAYVFAIPDDSDGATQADFFVDHGGGWSADGQTLPGTLDIEYNPYGDTCYDMSQGEMAAWIRDFNDQYHARTGVYPLVYSTANWWDNCVGSRDFASVNPLWVAHYTTGSPTLPDGWNDYTFWQYTSSGSVDGVGGDVDMNVFQDGLRDLVAFARGD